MLVALLARESALSLPPFESSDVQVPRRYKCVPARFEYGDAYVLTCTVLM